jgi:hypothetical protein
MVSMSSILETKLASVQGRKIRVFTGPGGGIFPGTNNKGPEYSGPFGVLIIFLS